MQDDWKAIGAFVLVIALGAIAALLTGYWPGILPLILDNDGPAGLNRDFARGLATDTISLSIQIVVTFLIVRFALGGRERKNKKLDRTELAKTLVELYTQTAQEILRTSQLPGTDSKKYRRTNDRFFNAMNRFQKSIDQTESKDIHELDDLYDKLVFEHDPNVRVDLLSKSEKVLKMLCPDELSLLRQLWIVRGQPLWRDLQSKMVEAVESFATDKLAATRAMGSRWPLEART
jgi:hypothetical protein